MPVGSKYSAASLLHVQAVRQELTIIRTKHQHYTVPGSGRIPDSSKYIHVLLSLLHVLAVRQVLTINSGPILYQEVVESQTAVSTYMYCITVTCTGSKTGAYHNQDQTPILYQEVVESQTAVSTYTVSVLHVQAIRKVLTIIRIEDLLNNQLEELLGNASFINTLLPLKLYIQLLLQVHWVGLGYHLKLQQLYMTKHHWN